MVNLKSAYFIVIMLLHEGLTHTFTQKTGPQVHYMLAFAVLCDVAYCSSLSKPHFEACTQLCSVGSVVRLLLVSQIVMYITDVLFAWVDFSDSVRCFLVL